ncbi:MAG TPA: PVC-type heme-binding CxxCH protein, partial [Prosthecobacter sp.]|nr:PVC-type heme-binding CxxCH protein [Prosthecobacter sp.]
MRLLLTLLGLALTGILHADPVSLFNGKTLDGWDYDPKMWRVQDGLITGGSTTEKITHNDFIATKKSYQNFELKLKIKVSGDPATGMLNSGIQIRSVRVPGGTHMSGYQIDCGKGWFGKIYDEFRRNKVIAEPVDPAALEKAVDVYGWNEYRIRAEGARIQTWINGVLAIDYTEADKNIAQDGHIGPQVHSGGVCLVQIKDITIEELPPTPGLPTWESLGGPEAARKLVAPPPKKADASKTKSVRDVSYNAVQGSAKTAEEQQKLFKLPPGYEIELVVKESEGLGKFVSVYFDQRGRLWTQTAFEYPVDANENPAVAEALYAGKGRDKVVHYPRESLNAPLPPGGLTNSTTFADGLAIPLGILPWGNGDTCYIQHGHDLKLFKDTNGDGKADTHEVILTGFGVQDSHLFPHQFTRAPGGWIWMAQGLFNNSKVTKPGAKDNPVDFPKCSMARMRPDGSNFEVTSTGPNNIWGLVITGEGEAFIQEANDYGYPVMPFHEYAYYPGGMEPLRKSYQPEFPPQAEFRMGGTGLSGLALGEGDFRKLTPTVKTDGLCMFVANPITSKIQTIAMHRDGPYWKLEQAPDLITCADPFFRPVGLTNGPDGSIYIVDWYNKIISHNEVPRTHPDRDKTRGRIWRVKPSKAPPIKVASASPGSQVANAHNSQPPTTPIPDFTKLSDDELISLLGTTPTARAHLAWQTLGDKHVYPFEQFQEAIETNHSSPARLIQLGWLVANTELGGSGADKLLKHENRNVRREVVRDLNSHTEIETALDGSFDADSLRTALV